MRYNNKVTVNNEAEIKYNMGLHLQVINEIQCIDRKLIFSEFCGYCLKAVKHVNRQNELIFFQDKVKKYITMIK
jgi:hypothetical protein